MNYRVVCTTFLVFLLGSSARSDPTPSVQPRATAAPPSANQLTPHPADAQNLAELVSELFPDRKDDNDPAEYEDLLLDFQHFGFLTIEDVRKVISNNLRAAEDEDAMQCRMFNDARKEATGSSAGRSKWFHRLAMARITLEKQVGTETYTNYEIDHLPRPPLKSAPKTLSGVSDPNAKTVRLLMRKQFDEITNNFVKGFFNGRAEVEKDHLLPLKKYIAETMPYEAFEREMIEADKRFAAHGGRPIDLEAVVKDETTGDQAVFLATVSQMAVLNVFNHLSVYQHEFIAPTDAQKSLFAKENDFERKVFISAITEEVPLSEFVKKSPGTKIDDMRAKIFHFRTPKYTWEQLFGREGYLIVLDGKITSVITTSLN